jgi:hypothetical protein
MARTVAIIHHRVADYDAWKAVYDSVSDLQRSGGVLEHAVLRPDGDPTMVVVVHTFADADTARAYFENAELRKEIERAGVDLDTLQLELLEEVLAGRP